MVFHSPPGVGNTQVPGSLGGGGWGAVSKESSLPLGLLDSKVKDAAGSLYAFKDKPWK